jgi:hypothetical protein
MLSDEEDMLLEHVLTFLADNFPNFAVAVLSKEDGNLHYDYSDWRIGRMLMRDSLEDMNEGIGMDFSDFEWDEEDEDYE